MNVKIMLNTNSLWPASGWMEIKGGDIVGASHILELDVNQGDVLRFILDKSITEDNGVLAWMPTIQYLDDKPDFGGTVVRILCGSKKDYRDSAENIWSADNYFTGGKAVQLETGEQPLAALIDKRPGVAERVVRLGEGPVAARAGGGPGSCAGGSPNDRLG